MLSSSRNAGSRLGLAALVAAAAGCAASVRVDPVTSLPPTAEAISLLGDTLWSVGFDIETAQVRLERLQRARQHAAAKPDDVNAALGLARRTGGMGRLREAIQLANAGLERHYDDARLYRLRGEFLLRTRRVDLAIRDLQTAARFTIQDSTTAEFVEIDDVGLIGIGLRYSTLLALGQAYYVRGDFRRARASLDASLQSASNADEAAGGGRQGTQGGVARLRAERSQGYAAPSGPRQRRVPTRPCARTADCHARCRTV
jgi:tetratricopeptide (TPR) repeat protein